jgi:4-carboxymuconolactone decarboxylase
MARLPYVPNPRSAGAAAPSDTARTCGPEPADVAAVYAEIHALGRPVLNLYRVLANQPPALRAFLGMSRYVRDESSLPAGLRELAILATAYALGVEYEQVHHVAAARGAGVAEAKLAAFPAWQTSDAFDDVERAAMTYAHEVATARRVNDRTFQVLAAYLSQGQIVDLALTVGWYHVCAALLLPLEVGLE